MIRHNVKMYSDDKFEKIMAGVLIIIILSVVIILLIPHAKTKKTAILPQNISSEYETSLNNLKGDFERLKANNDYLVSRIDDLEFQVEQNDNYIGDLKTFWKGIFSKQ